MKIVAIDIGQYMGFYNGTEAHTEWLGKEHRHVRMAKFYNFLNGYLIIHAPDVVAYERPFARGLAATRSGWGYAGVIEALATEHGAAVLDITNQTIRKFATGSGRMQKVDGTTKNSKQPMIDAAKRLTGQDLDEHSADAACLWHYINENMEVIPA